MEPIEFPKNYQTYLKQGQLALSEKKLPEALELFEAAYAIQQDTLVNWLIATTAFELGETQKAASYLKEQLAAYFADPHKREFMLQVLVVNQEFTLAEQTLWELKKTQSLSTAWVTAWEERIATQAEFYALEKRQQLTQLKTELLSLKDQAPYDQLALSKQALRLPKTELVTVAEQLLAEKAVFPLVRSFLFEELAKLAVTDEVAILLIDGTIQKLVPAQVGIPANQPVKQAIQQELKKQLENEDPVTLAALLDEVDVEFAALYPMPIDVTTVPAWVESYLKEYDLTQADSNDETVVTKFRQLILQQIYL